MDEQLKLLLSGLLFAFSPLLIGSLFGLVMHLFNAHPALVWVGGAIVTCAGYMWIFEKIRGY